MVDDSEGVADVLEVAVHGEHLRVAEAGGQRRVRHLQHTGAMGREKGREGEWEDERKNRRDDDEEDEEYVRRQKRYECCEERRIRCINGYMS